MATFSQNVVAIRKRVKKTHKKARTVGFLYFLGTILLTVFSLLPISTIQFEDGEALSIANFFKPFLWVFDGDFSGIMVFFFYLIMLIYLVVKIVRIVSPYKRVLKKNHTNVNTCNRNVSAMEDLGELFSSAFCAVVVLYSLMYIVTPDTGKIMVDRGSHSLMFSMLGWVMFAVATLIHFIGGVIGCTSSLFMVSSYIEERKREEGVGIFFLRSLIKIGFTFLFGCFVLPIFRIHTLLPAIFDLDFATLMGDIMALVGVVLQIVIVIFYCNCVKHATSALEFNLVGMRAHGMTFYNKHILICGLVAIIAFVLDKNPADGATITNYLFAGLIGIVGFVLILLVKPKNYEEKELGRSWEELSETEKAQPSKKEKEAVKEKEEETIANTTNAPASLKTPLVYSQNRGGVNIPNTIDLRIVLPDSSRTTEVEEAPMKWQVICPSCGRTLAVKESPYHRCPICGKVFGLNVGKIASCAEIRDEECLDEMMELPMEAQQEAPVMTKKEQRKAKAAAKKAAKAEKKAAKKTAEKSKTSEKKAEKVVARKPNKSSEPTQPIIPMEDDDEFTVTDTVIYE